MATWYECKISTFKIIENTKAKKVTETFLVDALSCTEAEARIIEERTPFSSGDLIVSSIKSTKYSEIFECDLDSADKWYNVKVAFITEDEKTAAVKRAISTMLVQASDFKNAYDNFCLGMKGTMGDFEIVAIAETSILDVYKAKLDK